MKMHRADIMTNDNIMKLNNNDVMKMHHAEFLKMATEAALKQVKTNGLVVDSGHSSTYSQSPLSDEQFSDRASVNNGVAGEVEPPATTNM